jgi:hypothetical protein
MMLVTGLPQTKPSCFEHMSNLQEEKKTNDIPCTMADPRDWVHGWNKKKK